jgi:hypothetical protein
MDRVGVSVPEIKDTDQFVFGAQPLRPWLVVNFLGFTIGAAAWGGLLRALEQPYYGADVSALEAARIQAISNGASTLLFGTVLGVAQWLILRRVIRAAWWVPASGLGFGLFGIVSAFNAGGSVSTIGPAAGPVPPLLSLLVIPPLVVILLSAGEWLILRRECEGAGWWPLVNVGALAAGLFLGFVVSMTLPWFASTDYPSARALAVVGAVAGPVYGYLTWLFLAQRRRRVSRAPEPRATIP